MRSILMLLLLSLALLAASCNPFGNYAVTSPDGSLTLTVSVADTFNYSVDFRGTELIRKARLGFILDSGEAFNRSIRCLSHNDTTVEGSFELPFGKRRTIREHYNELTLTLQERQATNRRIQLQVRVYDDAIAFRYLFPDEAEKRTISILEETTHFTFTSNPMAWFIPWPNYDNNHEGLYKNMLLSEAPNALLDIPLLLKFSDSAYVAITEANLNDYAGMFLAKSQGTIPDLFTTLSPYPGKDGIRVITETGKPTPWRVLLIGDRPGTLMESDVIVSLSDPCQVEDVSWMKPGKSTWHWWNGTKLEGVGFTPGMNYKTMKHYIDFCARNGIEYHSLVEAKGTSWYVNPGAYGLDPGPYCDVTRPVPELQMDRLLQYAREKGVGMRLWVHWKALEPIMEEAFKLYHGWGIQGLMVDFMDRNDQEMVNFYHTCIALAAKYHLHIQFHGAYIPTGLRRTYPNLFTTEAVLNTEWFRFYCTPEHNLTVPFTRMLAGPMDYHLGGFHSVRQGERCQTGQVFGTRCHNMAMYVVWEGYLQLLCDYPEAYEGQPGFEFLLQIPTTWDDMKVINGQVGDFVTVARRSGNDWYIGSMTDWTARSLDIPLDFLPEGDYLATIYEDAADTDENPDHLVKKSIHVTHRDHITAPLAAGGGQVVFVQKQ